MSITVTVRDESLSGETYHELPLEFPSERITVRELIRERVYQEVQDYNRRTDNQNFCGLVQPTDTERVLNGGRPEFKLKERRQIDWKPQLERALDSFEKNGFFILVDERQVDALDEELVVRNQSTISFVKLTPLVGG